MAMRTLVPGVALFLLAAGAAGGGEPAEEAKGRIIYAPMPPVTAAVYLPAGHHLAAAEAGAQPPKAGNRLWPVVVFLPGSAQTDGEALLAAWRKPADELGFAVAAPAGLGPDPEKGYPDLAIIGLVRGALLLVGGDPERVAVVGHLRAGRSASAVAFAYPRLARAVVAVGTAPAELDPPKNLIPKCPALLLMPGGKDVLDKCRARQASRKDLPIDVAQFPGAEESFTAATAAEAVGWIRRRFAFGPRERPEPPPGADDSAAAAALVAEGRALAAAGADAGAYVRLLAAARSAPRSAAARLELARASLTLRRFEEAADWAREAAGLAPDEAPPRMLAGEALLRLGRPKEALAELKAAGEPGRETAAAVERRLAELSAADPKAAREAFIRAAQALGGADFRAAAAAARAAVRAAPTENTCRVLAVYAVFNAEGLPAARKELADYLELFPADPQIRPLDEALAATAAGDPAVKGLPAKGGALLGRLAPAGPVSALLAAMAAKAGLAAEDARLAADLAEKIGAGGMGGGLLVLENRGLGLHVGQGTLTDLKTKLAAGLPVMVQLPPGELGGLRATERWAGGIPRLVVGYDDGARCVYLQDYGAKGPLGVPYGLFDLLWSRVNRWWLAVTPADQAAPGAAGGLERLELAIARGEAGEFQKALELLDKPGTGEAAPLRWRLARGGLLLHLNRPEEARAELRQLASAPPAFAVPALVMLGGIEEGAGRSGPAPADAALEFYRRAWRAEPAHEPTVVTLAMALVARGRPEDLAEARNLADDYLRLRPGSLPILTIYYHL